METAQHSEDLFGSIEDTNLEQVEKPADADHLNISDVIAESVLQENEERSEKEASEKETPDLVFSEDLNFAEQTENNTKTVHSEDLPEVEDNAEGPTTEAVDSGAPAGGQVTLKNSIESAEERLAQFPFARVKQIMKLDPAVGILTAEAIFVVTKAAELFLQTLAKDTSSHTLLSKKKTMGLRDVEAAIDSIDSLMFLEGMMNVK